VGKKKPMQNVNEEESIDNSNSSGAMIQRLSANISKKIVGVILIGCVVVLWVGSSVLIQFVFKNQRFDKPLFLTYYDTSLFMLYLFGFLFVGSWRKSLIYYLKGFSSLWNHQNNITLVADAADATSGNNGTDRLTDEQSIRNKRYYNIPHTIATSLILCPMWFLANVTFNYSLSKTSVASNTIISNTSSLFTFILGLLFGIDSFSFLRLLAVAMSIGGVALVTSFDQSNASDNSTTIGNLLTLFSAFMYGVYTTYLKKRIPEEEEEKSLDVTKQELEAPSDIGTSLPILHIDGISVEDEASIRSSPVLDTVSNPELSSIVKHKQNISNVEKSSLTMVFGFMGLFNFLTLWPLFFIMHGTGVETFRIPDWKIMLSVTINGLIGTMLSDLLWALSVIYTSPIVSTIGLALTIPLAFLADLVMYRNKSFSVEYVLGSALVIISFITANFSYYLPYSIKKLDSPDWKKMIKRLRSMVGRGSTTTPSDLLHKEIG